MLQISSHLLNQGKKRKISFPFPVYERSGNLGKMPQMREVSTNFVGVKEIMVSLLYFGTISE